MRRKSQFPHTATLFTATVGQYLRSVRGCRPTPREDLSCGTRRETESLSNPAGQWHLSAAPAWRKTSFTYENQTLLHRFFLFPMSFILLLFVFLFFLFHTAAGVSATFWQGTEPWASSTAVSKWCHGVSQYRRAKLSVDGREGMPWQGLRAAPHQQQAQGEGGCFPGQQPRGAAGRSMCVGHSHPGFAWFACCYLTQLHTFHVPCCRSHHSLPKTGLRCYYNNGESVGFRLSQLMALRVFFSSLFRVNWESGGGW